MAIMKRCCCLSNTRSGSLAVAAYSLLYSVGYTVVWIIQFLSLEKSTGGFENVSSHAGYAIYAGYFIDVIVLGFLFISSFFLIIGVLKNIKGLLIPHMIAITALIVFQAIAWSLQIFGWLSFTERLTIAFIASLSTWVVLAFVNVICLLCVISQYQELRDGSGQEQDDTTNNTPTCPRVITSPSETTITSYPILDELSQPTVEYNSDQAPPFYNEAQSYAQATV